MKLHIMSDLHIEFGHFEPPETDADVIVLAGDVHLHGHGVEWIMEHFPHKPVLYVLGNHEFYRGSLPRFTRRLHRLTADTSLTLLENEVKEIDGVWFFGCTLWTDFRLFGDRQIAMLEAADQMSDYWVIRNSDRGFRKLRPNDTAALHRDSLNRLHTALREIPPGFRRVIITHHAPSRRSVPERFRRDLVSAAYASNLDELVDDTQAALWIHGHMHDSADYMIGRTRVLCNPRGYAPRTNPEFNPGLVVEL